MKLPSVNTLLVTIASLTLSACIFGERPPSGPQGSTASDDTNKLILNDTGVDFYLEHNVANSPEAFPIPATTPGATAPGQDAGTGADYTEPMDSDGHLGFNFTKLDGETGAALAADAPLWSCVKDNTTGLIWEVKTLGGDHAAGSMYTWYDPTDTNGGDPGMQAKEGDCGGKSFLKGNTYDFIQKVNEHGLCGFNDWRLPLREEFRSIIDYGVPQEWTIGVNGKLTYKGVAYMDENYFPNMLQRRHRWTAESSYNDPTKAWAFHPNDGKSEVHPKACNSDPNNNFTNGIMLVRGPN